MQNDACYLWMMIYDLGAREKHAQSKCNGGC